MWGWKLFVFNANAAHTAAIIHRVSMPVVKLLFPSVTHSMLSCDFNLGRRIIKLFQLIGL